MRVTHLSPSGEIGGAERVLLECIRVARGVQSTVVTLGDGPLLAQARALGAEARFVEAPASLAAAGDAFDSIGRVAGSLVPALSSFPGFVQRFSDALKTSEPDVVHSHGIKTHVLAAMLRRRAPVVWHLHDYVSTRSVSSKLLRTLAHRCDLAIAVSGSIGEDARRVLPVSVPLVVIHNAIDTDRFVPDGPVLDLDDLSGLPPADVRTIRVGLPATFAKWKGHEVFLDAVARLGDLDVRAYIIGGSVYQTRNSQWSRAELEAFLKGPHARRTKRLAEVA